MTGKGAFEVKLDGEPLYNVKSVIMPSHMAGVTTHGAMTDTREASVEFYSGLSESIQLNRLEVTLHK